MALTNENGGGMVMPVQPMGYGGYSVPMFGGYGNGFGGFGGDLSGFIVLFLIAAMFGGFGGGWGMGGLGGFGGMMAFPWLMTGQAGINANTNDGFNNAGLSAQISGLRSDVTGGFGDTALGIAGINQNICSTGGQITAAVTNGFAQAEIAENARQMSNMQQAFNSQTAVTGAINGVSSQLADCCCEQRLATAKLSALVQSENCADREALSNGIRDIITAQNAGTQRILDQLCQDKIDAKNEKIQELQTQVTMQNLAASQAAQTAQLMADNSSQTQYIVNRVAPYPIPAYPAYGPCNNNWGYGNFGGNPFGNVGFGNGSF
jgi:hypothetical protein